MSKFVKVCGVVAVASVAGRVLYGVFDKVNKKEHLYEETVSGLVKTVADQHSYFAQKAIDEHDAVCANYANGIAKALNEAVRVNSENLCELGFTNLTEIRLTDDYKCSK